MITETQYRGKVEDQVKEMHWIYLYSLHGKQSVVTSILKSIKRWYR